MKVQKIKAGGGVPFRYNHGKTEVLLIFRRGIWDLPKGKKEDHETFNECAVREVMEEIGASEVELSKQLIDTYHEYRQNEINYGKTTRWFAMKIMDNESGLQPQKEEQIEELEWCTLGQAKKLVGFPNLQDVLEDFGNKML